VSLPNGVIVCLTEEEKVEIFNAKKDLSGSKVYSDPAVKGDMLLFHSGQQVRLTHEDKLYSFKVKK
jgi:hypothetical protein